MTSEAERLILNTFDLNDLVKITTETLGFTPAQPKPKFAENANADGVVLVEEPQFTPCYFDLQLRVEPTKTLDEALEVVGEVMDALQSCAQTEGGAPLEWTPNTTGTTYTAYALLAELNELPITQSGDLAGWFLESPVLKVKITCRPFLHTPERVVIAAVESSGEPIQVAYAKNVGGDVPAEAKVILTDKATKARRYAEIGQDAVESESNPSLLLKAEPNMVVTGFAGFLSSVPTGKYSAKVVQATLRTRPQVLCSTGPIAHVGSFREKMRCRAEGEGAAFRLSYRIGDGPWTPLKWIEPPMVGEWVELDMGEVFLDEALSGEQVSEIRMEGKVTTTSCTGYIDYLDFMPTRRYGVARAPLEFDVPSVLSVVDPFNQSAGAFTGKIAEVGGEWTALTNSDTTDFESTGAGKLIRKAVSDTGKIGIEAFPRLGRAIATPVEMEDLVCSYDFNVVEGGTEVTGTFAVQIGMVLGYQSNTKFVTVLIRKNSLGGPHFVEVRDANEALIAKSANVLSIGSGAKFSGTLLAFVKGENLTVCLGPDAESLVPVLSCSNSQIGIKGRVAIIDERKSAEPATREFDNFALWKPEPQVVCNSTRSVQFRSDDVERDNTGATYLSPVPRYRGANILLDPEGDANLINRLVVKMRRNDTAVEADSSVTDKHKLEVLVRERFLAPR